MILQPETFRKLFGGAAGDDVAAALRARLGRDAVVEVECDPDADAAAVRKATAAARRAAPRAGGAVVWRGYRARAAVAAAVDAINAAEGDHAALVEGTDTVFSLRAGKAEQNGKGACPSPAPSTVAIAAAAAAIAAGGPGGRVPPAAGGNS